jgi:hypothetical protein
MRNCHEKTQNAHEIICVFWVFSRPINLVTPCKKSCNSAMGSVRQGLTRIGIWDVAT